MNTVEKYYAQTSRVYFSFVGEPVLQHAPEKYIWISTPFIYSYYSEKVRTLKGTVSFNSCFPSFHFVVKMT
jgi:hypothetical protein